MVAENDEPISAQAQQLGYALTQLAASQSLWSQQTFGADTVQGPLMALRHLRKEVAEAIAMPSDPLEYADLLLLTIDAARRAGLSIDSLVQVAAQKHEINRRRSWGPIERDQPVEHIRDEQVTERHPKY